MSEEETETDHGLLARATALENELQRLRQASAPTPLDADYERCFMKAHRDLTAERVPDAVPKAMLRDKLLQSLRDEQESLKRMLAVYTDQIKAAEAEIAELEDHNKAVAPVNGRTPPIPNDYDAVKKLTRRQQRHICEYLKHFYLEPPKLENSSMCNYLTLSEIFDRLVEASTKTPEERYIELDVGFWPPHVQVLLNANVVERDPDRNNYIRLQDWG